MRDSQRETVYQAEYRLRDLYDTAEMLGHRVVTIDGITLTLPPEARFGCIPSMQRYVDRVVGQGQIAVRERRGVAKAHYEPWARTIAIPNGRNRWACREIVVLHELAHHRTRSDHTGGVAAHGREFVGEFTQLLSDTMGPEVGLAYRVLCSHSGVKESA